MSDRLYLAPFNVGLVTSDDISFELLPAGAFISLVCYVDGTDDFTGTLTRDETAALRDKLTEWLR